jgi:hypothetical protein
MFVTPSQISAYILVYSTRSKLPLGPVESITGVLMCGISVSCLFAVATRLVERESGAPPMQYVNGLDGRSKAELENVS